MRSIGLLRLSVVRSESDKFVQKDSKHTVKLIKNRTKFHLNGC